MVIEIVVLVIILALLAGGFYFAWMIIFPHTRKPDFSYQQQMDEGKLVLADYQAMPKQEVSIPSPYGYSLYGIYFPSEGSKKTVIIAHGITDTLYGSVKYMNLMRSYGFNVLIYDHRNHGHNQKKNTTYGFYEKFDLKAVVDFCLAHFGGDVVLGTMGESMGAATVLQHCAIDPRVAFVIADCPYSDLTELLKYHLKLDYHMPAFPLLNLADFFCWLMTGMTFSKVSPIRDITHAKLPIFWIHGQDDLYILPKMSEDMYQAKKQGARKIFLAPNAGHADSLWKNREEYARQVGEFLAAIGLKD